MQKITKNSLLILLGTIFFLLSPIMYERASHHEALAAHWLILAAFYLYFSPDSINIKTKWACLIFIATLVHFYLLVMVLIIWSAYIIESLLKEKKYDIFIKYVVTTMCCVFFIMWIEGYFVIPFGNASSTGFGYFSMNILAPFNSMGGGETRFFDKIAMASVGQREGFNYLGLGLLLMMGVAFFTVTTEKHAIKINKHIILISLMAIIYLFSLSGKITMGNEVLTDFQYPWLLGDIGNILRASGRMFWPVYYLLTFSTLFIIFKYFNEKKSIYMLIVFLSIQIIDFYPWYSFQDLNARTWTSTLQSSHWQKLAKNIEHIVMIPPERDSDYGYNLSFYAATNNLDINVGYLAREDKIKTAQYNEKTMASFFKEKFEDKTLYVISDEYFSLLKNTGEYTSGQLDYYKVVTVFDSQLTINNSSNTRKESIVFDSTDVVFSGWSQLEKSHRWSLDKSSEIIFSLYKNQIIKNLQGKFLLNIGTLGQQEITVLINGVFIGKKTVNSWNTIITFEFNPQILNQDKTNTIQFKFPDAHKPDNGDSRVLAMAFKGLKIQ